MLLAVDVGNTNISIGIFQNDSIVVKWTLKTDLKTSQEKIRLGISTLFKKDFPEYQKINGVIIGSVVPSITPIIRGAIEQITNLDVKVMDTHTRTDLIIIYNAPSDVGSDRICDAVSANILYPNNKIIVDFGTATVFDAITESGEYLGGAISPGIKIASDSLHLNTSLLKKIEVAPTKKLIGTNTIDSLKSGLFWGYLFLVEGMIKGFKKEIINYSKKTKNNKITVIATGGLAPLMASYTKLFDEVNLDLTLKGLNFIYKLNFR